MYLASDEMLHCHQPRPLVMERRWTSNVELAPNCPRCASSNTKFCYYNNYSMSQPRYFCKGCRRYWTKGGSLRNVPVGGGCRKSRRTRAIRPLSDGRTQVSTDDRSLSPRLGTSDRSLVVPPGSGSDGPNIDLAAVFAKFLNHTEETNQLWDVSGSPNQDIRVEDMLAECQTQSSMTEEGERLFAVLGEGFLYGDHILQDGQPQEFRDHILQEEQAQKFPRFNPNSFGLETMLGDELVQDLMWSDSTNFGWQPMVQLQDFGSFPCDDQSDISTNVGDNWSLFDLPAYEIFSRP